MKYRHTFHAGGFADVHKHVTLLALLASLKRKDAAFLYLETHAGRGAYDLQPRSETDRQAQASLAKLVAATPHCTELAAFVAQLQMARSKLVNPQAYPGSPLFAAQQLRPQDRAVLNEIVPAEARALQRVLRGYARMHVEAADGFARLRAYWPPPERRSLALIDPPYEERDDWQRVVQSCAEALRRFRSGIVAAWFPIKDARSTAAWERTWAAQLECETLVSQWWLYPRDSRVSLNGSGVLILNPPHQFAVRMQLWLQELHAKYAHSGSGGGVSVHTLRPTHV